MTELMSHALYLPYGAYELKAAYQRNMLIGMATPLVMILMVFAAVALWPAPSGLVAITGTGPAPDSIITIIDWKRPPSIILETPTSSVPQSHPAVEQGSIPVAVPDNELPVEDAVLPSQDELRSMLGQGFDPGDGGNLPAILPTPDIIPPPDTFIPLEIRPQMIFEAKPEYPRLNRIAGLSGAVWVNVLLDKEGNVKEVRVSRSSGNQSFDEAAAAAAYKCKFSPGIQNGTPVYCWVTFKIDFRLSE